MRVLQFIKKEILHAFSSPESLMLMILFPFALTLVLGLAFSSSFSLAASWFHQKAKAVVFSLPADRKTFPYMT